MPRTQHAIIFGMDGCRPDALLAAKTPHIDQIIANGAFAPNAQTGEITISGPGWSDMLTSVWHPKHGVRDNSFEGKNYTQYPHFFRRLKEKRPELVAASIVNWSPINEQILSAADYQSETQSDPLVLEETTRYLQNADPNLIFLQLDDVDAAGHKHGYAPDSAGYLAAIESNDAMIGAIWEAIRSRPNYDNEDWLLIVSTDHGGTEYGHGRDIPEHRTIFIAAHHSGGRPILLREPAQIVDIPALIAAHIGIEIDPGWEWEGVAAFGE